VAGEQGRGSGKEYAVVYEAERVRKSEEPHGEPSKWCYQVTVCCEKRATCHMIFWQIGKQIKWALQNNRR
jgi:hypothetical protein